MEPLDIKKNLGDALSSMVKGCKVDLGKNKRSATPASFVIGNKKLTTVKRIDPEIVTLDDKLPPQTTPRQNSLPKNLRITKLDNGAKDATPKQIVKQTSSVQSLLVQSKTRQPFSPKQDIWQLASKPQNSVQIKKVESLPGITVQKISDSKPEAENQVATTPKRIEKENVAALRTNVRSVSTPVQKRNLESPTLTRSSGRILKKPSIINSQKKVIVKTIKKLNDDQKKRIEERLGDIGSNLQKIKPKDEAEEEPKEVVPEPVVDKRPLKEILSDKDWLNMFLQIEPTARYNPVDDTIYCHTCKDMFEDGCDDGWVEGHPKGVEWLKYREHKMGEEHQKTSTKYYMQLFTAHVKYL